MPANALVCVRKSVGLLALLAVGIGLTGCDLLNVLPTLPPDKAPTGVTASYGQPDRVEVRWGAVERASNYRVYRADAQGETYSSVGETPSLSYIDIVGAENQGRLYWYKVEACNSAGCGPKSAAAAGYAGIPPAPANVQASDGTYRDKIVITWVPVPGATYYQVFRDLNPDVGFNIVGDNIPTTSFEDTTATPGTRYWYRVRACHDTGCSALSQADDGWR